MSERSPKAMTADLLHEIPRLSARQLAYLSGFVRALTRAIDVLRDTESDIVSAAFVESFGDIIRIHHCMSSRPVTKEHFERAFEQCARESGMQAELAARGNPGHDITINGVRFSLKSQADQSIRADVIHISKFMELGKGRWKTKADLAGLRDRFLHHLEGYDRILSLRAFPLEADGSKSWKYELVEIPKDLLQMASSGEIRMQHNSSQNPKPGYCTVRSEDGEVLFELYFDGGTERKLQIKHLVKSACRVHAEWKLRVD
jgi:hypothetical protein